MAITPAPRHDIPGQPSGTSGVGPPGPGGSRGHIGLVVAGSLAAGLLLALLLVFAPFIPPEERRALGAVLCGFALGWAMLAVLSSRLTDQPQRWAAAPAAFMGFGALLLLTLGTGVDQVLSWVWPPMLAALVVWMVVRVRRDLHSRGARLPLYVVLAILTLCAVGGGWQTVSEANESNPYLTSGRLIDVDGHRMHLSCAGSGSPTVVLEPGAGGTSASMGWVAPAVARQTRVCVYDRAGRGGSEPADTVQDGAQVATDLHTLLHQAAVPGPYVLAGHSFGGLYVRIFAAHYPDEVAGLVLLDSTASREPARSVISSTKDSNDGVARFATLTSLAARVGLARLYADLVGGTLPAPSEAKLRYDTAQATTVRSVVDEYARGGAAAQEAASLRDFGDKPLFVLTAGEHSASWIAAQRKLTALSTNSAQEVVDGATHAGLEDEEQYATYITRAVMDVVSSVRSGQPLDR